MDTLQLQSHTHVLPFQKNKQKMSKSRKGTVAGPRRETTAPDSRIRKNHRGGVLVTPEEIKLAFDFLDCDKSGKVSLANLKKRLTVFFPEMSAKEYRFMMNNKREMTLQDFNDMLLDNEVTNFDPVAEAFKVRQDIIRKVVVNI